MERSNWLDWWSLSVLGGLRMGGWVLGMRVSKWVGWWVG